MNLRRTALGYWQQDPLPTPDELQQFYADKYFQEGRGHYQDNYDQDDRAWLHLDARIAAHVYARHHPVSDGEGARTLLDVGCGQGFFLAGMQQAGFDVRGCDFSDYSMRAFQPALLDRFEHGNLFSILDRHIDAG